MWPWGCFETLSGLTDFRETAGHRRCVCLVKWSARGQGQRCLAQEFGKEGNPLLLEYRDGLSVRTSLTGMPRLPSTWVVCHLSDTASEHVHEYSLLSNSRGCLWKWRGPGSQDIGRQTFNTVAQIFWLMFSSVAWGGSQLSWPPSLPLTRCSPPHFARTLWLPRSLILRRGS